MRSQGRLARNLEESPKGSTATWKIKRGSILSRHTNIQPQQLLPTEPKRRHTSKRSGWHLTSCTILRLPSPPTRDLASPGPGCRQAGPKLHTTLGRSRQPGEAKLSFHKTRPHPQEGSQPFVWKKRGLLVLTSSSLPSRPTCGPAPRCLPLPDHFSGHQLPDSTPSPRGVARRSASCAFPCLSLPPSTQSRVLEAHSAQRPRSPSPTGSSNSLACSVAVLP